MATSSYAPPSPYKAKDVSGALPEYDSMRTRLNQRVNADTQQQTDAMQRRFAAMGGLNSGAAIKQEQLIAQTGVQNREQGLQDIDSQESAERRRLREAEAQKEFQSGEAAAGRDFEAGQSELGRQFTAGESQKGREFTAGENVLGRQFSSGEAEKGRQFQSGESALGRQFQAGESEKGRQFTAGESALGRQFQARESALSREQQQQQFDAELKFKSRVAEWEDSYRSGQLDLAWEQLNLAQDESTFNKGVALADLDTLQADRAQKYIASHPVPVRKSTHGILNNKGFGANS